MSLRLGNIFFGLAILAIAMSACSRENDVYPKVEILEPSSLQTYDFGDTITVTARVTDHTGDIRFNILLGATVMSIGSELYDQVGNEYTHRFYLTDRYLETGQYDIRVTAFNESNGSSAFQRININELPKRQRGVVFLHGNEMSRIDSNGMRQSIDLGAAYQYISANGRDGHIIVGSQTATNLQSYDFKTLGLNYSVNIQTTPGFDPVNGVDTDRGNTYVFQGDGQIATYGKNGLLTRSFKLPGDWIAESGDVREGTMIVVAKDGARNAWALFILNPTTGGISAQYGLSGPVRDVAAVGNGHYLLTYQSNGIAELAHFDVNQVVLTPFDTRGAEEATDLLVVSNSVALWATDGGVSQFNPTSLIPTTQWLTIPVDHMAFDDVGNELYIASGSDLMRVPLGGNPGTIYAGQDPITEVDIMFNK